MIPYRVASRIKLMKSSTSFTALTRQCTIGVGGVHSDRVLTYVSKRALDHRPYEASLARCTSGKLDFVQSA